MCVHTLVIGESQNEEDEEKVEKWEEKFKDSLF
jgi:hypothetical protein